MRRNISGMMSKLYIVDNATEKIIAGQRGANISRTADTIDTTSKDSEGYWRESIQGFKDWSVSTDGIYVTNDEALRYLQERFENSQNVDVILVMEDGVTFSGEATISDFSMDVPYDDAVNYSLTLQGSGPLREGTVVDI